MDGTNVAWFAEDLKNEFHPIGYSQLVEDLEDVILDRVLANGKRFSDFTIRESLDQAMYNLFFPRGQGYQPLAVELGRYIGSQC